jgi:hypothetical protein
MLKRSWLQALAITVCALALTACGGNECENASDCSKKGPAPEGREYQCIANTCELRAKPTPAPTCSPECATGEVCDGSSGTGVCRTCTATQGCTAPLFCDTAANSGKGVCRACSDTGNGTDQGCSSAAPVCDPAGGNGAGVCKTCADTATGGAIDSGCSASTPMCEPTANNGAGICKACADSTPGNAQDLGCSTSSPVCDPAAASGVGACKTCVDSATGTDTDTGCSDAAPICNTSASGGKGVCRACLDSATGTGTDTGCSDTAPICDSAAGGGAGACTACVNSSTGSGQDLGCGTATPFCDDSAGSAARTCRACVNSATGTDMDLGCSGTAPLCDIISSNDTGTCKTCVDTSATSSSADLGCASPLSICDVQANNGGGVCKLCLSDTGCSGNQTCNAEGTACQGCANDTECSPPTAVCKPPTGTELSACVECTTNTHCPAGRPACNTANNICGCTSDDQCSAAPGNTDYCNREANRDRGQCTVCLTDAHCTSATHPFCDDKTACIQCRSNANCSLTQVCNPTSKACEAAPGVDPAATSAQIQSFLDAPIGQLIPPITIENAYVTYIKPALGTDLPGFFVQAQPNGPAMFVAVEAATFLVQVGDRITFSVGEVQRLNGDLEAAATITNLSISGRGYPVQNLTTDSPPGLTVDRSGANDLQTNLLTQYESELIRLSGSIVSGTNASGGGHVAFNITTAGMTTSNNNFRLRVPITLSDHFNIVQGCTFTLKAGPMWRFTSTGTTGTTNNAQPSAYYTSDLLFPSCPKPTLQTAIDASATTVVLTFDRNIDPASVTDAATQFTFNNGLTATAAQVNGKTVTVTTSPQNSTTTYTVTVAGTVKDTVGGAVAAPTNPVTFKGFRTRAVLMLNEVNPNIGSTSLGNRDLIELKVVSAGTTDGLTLIQEPANASTQALLATMPDTAVAVGDFIVIHMSPDATKGDATTSETTAKDQNAAATNYATAWDFVGTATHIVYSNQVLRIKGPTGATQDAVPFVVSTLTNRPAAFPDRLTAIQTEGLWMPADCGGAPCLYDPPTGVPSAISVSVDWKNLGNSSTGNSLRRVSATDNNTASDWATAPATPTWGAENQQ